MKMKFIKAFKDLVIYPRRTFLVIFALALGIWGVGTVLVSYYILTQDLNTNFQRTSPPHLVLRSQDFDRLDLQLFNTRSEVEAAEFRDRSLLRIEIKPDVWVPLILNGVESFDSFLLAKIFREEGDFPPEKGTIIIERDGKKMSNLDIGSTTRARSDNKMLKVTVSGVCFDPAQAPATQDRLMYSYTDKGTYSSITGNDINMRLMIRFNDVQSQQELENITAIILSDFEKMGIHVSDVNIPLLNEHPHQWQLNTTLFLVGAIGFLAFIMGTVLVSQLMQSIMANQVRQIGIIKAIGGTRFMSFQIYIIMLLIIGLFAGAMAVPLAVISGTAYSNFVAAILNFNILTKVPTVIYIYFMLGSLFLPIMLSLPALLKGTGISVREALTDYGINDNASFSQWKLLKQFKLSNKFSLALKNTLRNSKRLTVTVVTMALGVAIFSTGFNVRQSLKNLLADLNNTLRYDVQVVLKNPLSKDAAIKPFNSIANVKEVGFWNEGSGASRANSLSTDKGAGIVALPFNTTLLKPNVIEGQWLGDIGGLEIVMNQKAWELYDYVPLGSNVNLIIGDTEVTTKFVGVVEQFDLGKIYMDQGKYNEIFNPENFINTLTFLAENNDFNKVMELKKNIEAAIVSSDLNIVTVMSNAERVRAIYAHLNIILSSILILSFLVLLVSAFGMASATGINIGERTREIGVMRAIGATPKMIYSLFITEGMIISIASIFFGLIISFPLSKLASIFFGNLMLGERAVLQYAFSPIGCAVTLVATLLFGWLASRIPARNAVKTSTRDALAYE